MTLFQPSRILEIGPAYGLSTTFLAEASTAPITTVETWEPMKTLSSSRLGQRYADRVSCVHVPVQQHAHDSFPMVFHDADHCAAAYIADFAAVEPSMPSGAVLVLDDINVRDSNAGWQRILAHPRVQHAIEIDGNIGVAVLA